MLNITNAELWAFNALNNLINNAQQELERVVASRDAYVKLIEDKYDAEFDMRTGQFNAKKKEKEMKK